MQLFDYIYFVVVNVVIITFCLNITGGLVCFTIRADGVKDFSEKIAELENQGKWILVKEGKVPHYNKEDMPRECSAFAYKVSKN